MAFWLLISVGSPQIEYSSVAGGPEYPVAPLELVAGEGSPETAGEGSEPGVEPAGEGLVVPPHAAARSASTVNATRGICGLRDRCSVAMAVLLQRVLGVLFLGLSAFTARSYPTPPGRRPRASRVATPPRRRSGRRSSARSHRA